MIRLAIRNEVKLIGGSAMASDTGNPFRDLGDRRQRSPVLVVLAIGIGLICATPATSAGELHDAVRAQDKVAVEAVLASDVEVDETDFIFGTPLHVAVSDGNTEIARILVNHGANLEAASEQQGARPLHLAAQFGHVPMLALLLDRGAEIEAFDDLQRTPLLRAAIQGHAKAAQLLLDRGAAVDGRDGIKERTPLMMASYFGRLELVRLMIDHGGDINATDSFGETSLHFAVGDASYRNARGPAVIEYLVMHGANMNVKRRDGLTPLGYAKVRGFKETPDVLRRLGASE